jgi:hypothetical protein
MMHEWTVSRGLPDGDAILGTLETHGGATCYTLERAAVAIPEGRFQVTLTVSQRARGGALWAPGSDFKLPLLTGVPGRSSIRMHAGNAAQESDGCLLLGAEVQGLTLLHSRPALIRIVNLLHDADRDGDVVFLTVTGVKQPNWSKA